MSPGRPDGRERLIRSVTAVSLAFSTIYIIWRWGWTLNTEALWFSVPLALAETYGLLTAFFLAFSAWGLARRPTPRPLRGRSVDVFVTTYNEPLSIIRKTALAARAIRYPHSTYLLDDGRREEVRRLAEELGIGYITRPTNEHAKAGNLNNALRHTSGEFILQLDADHVPLPTILDRMLGWFADERVAFVQSPQDFYNTDAFTYEVDVRGRRIWEDQQLFFRVLQPGKDRVNAAFFVGSCAVIRRAALEEIGGFATETITEDIETSLVLHSRGWRSVFVNETLAYGLAPANALAFHVQHLRWGQGAMQTLRRYKPLRMPGLTFAQRIAYFDSLTTYLGGFQRLILYLAPLVFFVTGIFPLHASATAFALMFVPYLALQLVSFKLLARGHGSLLLADRFAMAKFFTHLLAITGYLTRRRLGFRVTPKQAGAVPLRIYAPQAMLVLFTLAALGWAVYERTLGVAPDEVPGWGVAAFWVNAAYALWNTAVAFNIVRVSRSGQHRRAEHRFAEALAVTLRVLRTDGRLAGYDIAITDNLNPYGAALRCMHPIEPGGRVEMKLPLSTREVAVRGHVVHRAEHRSPYGTVYVHGVEFDGLDPDARDAIELHCAQHATPLERQRFREGTTSAQGALRRLRNLRQQPRLAVGVPVRISAGTGAATRSLGIGLLEDVSPLGARMLLDHPVAPGSDLRLEVPGTDFATDGRIVFVHALETSVGVRFVAGLTTSLEGAGVMSNGNWLDEMLAAAGRYASFMRRPRTPANPAGGAIVDALSWKAAARPELPPAAAAPEALVEAASEAALVAAAAATIEPEVAPVEASPVPLPDDVPPTEAPETEEPPAETPPAEAPPFAAPPIEVPQFDVPQFEIPPAEAPLIGEPEPVGVTATAHDDSSASTDPIPQGELPMQTASANAQTLLAIRGSAARLEGKFDIADSIEVQCELNGELVVGDTLVIGEQGTVNADVKTVNAVIHGTYSGTLSASGSIEIAATGRVSGTIESNELIIAKGAVFTGSVARVERPAAAAAEAQPQAAAQPQAPAAQPAAAAAPAPTVPIADVAIPVIPTLADAAGEPFTQLDASAPGARLQSITLS